MSDTPKTRSSWPRSQRQIAGAVGIVFLIAVAGLASLWPRFAATSQHTVAVDTARPVQSAATPPGRVLQIVISGTLDEAIDMIANHSVALELRSTSMLSPSCGDLLRCVADVSHAVVHLQHHNGVLIAATGRGSVAIVRLPVERGADHRQLRANLALPLVIAAAAQSTTPAIFHFSFCDVDVFGHALDLNDASSRHETVLRYLGDSFPFLFFLHHSPRVVNAFGRLGRNMIPIPGGEAVRSAQLPPIAPKKPWAGKPPRGVWRGATTGLPAPGRSYSSTDRFRLVKLLNQRPDLADVKFTDEVQSHVVRDDPIPSGWFGEFIPPELLTDEGRVQIDVDGNCNSVGGLYWKLQSGGPVLHINSTRGHVQWYYYLLRDGVHVLSATLADPDDLIAKLKFLATSDGITSMISRSARKFSDVHLSRSAIESYVNSAISAAAKNVPVYSARDWRIKPLPQGYRLSF